MHRHFTRILAFSSLAVFAWTVTLACKNRDSSSLKSGSAVAEESTAGTCSIKVEKDANISDFELAIEKTVGQETATLIVRKKETDQPLETKEATGDIADTQATASYAPGTRICSRPIFYVQTSSRSTASRYCVNWAQDDGYSWGSICGGYSGQYLCCGERPCRGGGGWGQNCPDTSNYCRLACAGYQTPRIPRGCMAPACSCR